MRTFFVAFGRADILTSLTQRLASCGCYFVLYRSVNQAPDYYLSSQHLARTRTNAIISDDPDTLIARADHRENIGEAGIFCSKLECPVLMIFRSIFFLGLVDPGSWCYYVEEKDVLGQC